MTPIFLALMVIDFPHHYAAALLVFILASLTDWLDGKIARKNNLVTNLGKFLDPLADKALTTAAFLGFLAKLGGAHLCWALFLILAREFAVTSVRLLAAKDGVVITSKYVSSYGNYVVISHGSGNTTLYAHMSSRKVKAGDKVKQGQIIGVTGSTGVSSGPHLHYEITEKGSRVDPKKYLPGWIQAW